MQSAQRERHDLQTAPALKKNYEINLRNFYKATTSHFMMLNIIRGINK
jgi:hypothetical protein